MDDKKNDNVFNVDGFDFIYERTDNSTTQLSLEKPTDTGDVVLVIQAWWDKNTSFHCDVLVFDKDGMYVETTDNIGDYLSDDVIKDCYIKLMELSKNEEL